MAWLTRILGIKSAEEQRSAEARFASQHTATIEKIALESTSRQIGHIRSQFKRVVEENGELRKLIDQQGRTLTEHARLLGALSKANDKMGLRVSMDRAGMGKALASMNGRLNQVLPTQSDPNIDRLVARLAHSAEPRARTSSPAP